MDFLVAQQRSQVKVLQVSKLKKELTRKYFYFEIYLMETDDGHRKDESPLYRKTLDIGIIWQWSKFMF